MHSKPRRPPTIDCFQTNASGDILLETRWPALLQALGALDPCHVQTRHPYARLISLTKLPAWSSPREAGIWRDPENRLHVNTEHWDHAVVRLDGCACCGSPGCVEIRNRRGLASLEFRLTSSGALDTLAQLATEFSDRRHVAPETSLPGTVCLAQLNSGIGRRLPAELLLPLLEACAEKAVPLMWRLLTPEADHRRVFCPTQVSMEDGVLTAIRPGDSSCQLIMQATASLLLQDSERGSQVHLLTAEDFLLLTLSCPRESEALEDWETLLNEASKQGHQDEDR